MTGWMERDERKKKWRGEGIRLLIVPISIKVLFLMCSILNINDLIYISIKLYLFLISSTHFVKLISNIYSSNYLYFILI